MERCLRGDKNVVVAYDKDDVFYVWLYEDGEYTRFELIEGRFKNMDLSQVEEMKKQQKEMIEQESHSNLQSDLSLIEHIQNIKNNALAQRETQKSNVKDIRTTNKKERSKKHRNHIQEAGLYGD